MKKSPLYFHDIILHVISASIVELIDFKCPVSFEYIYVNMIKKKNKYRDKILIKKNNRICFQQKKKIFL